MTDSSEQPKPGDELFAPVRAFAKYAGNDIPDDEPLPPAVWAEVRKGLGLN